MQSFREFINQIRKECRLKYTDDIVPIIKNYSVIYPDNIEVELKFRIPGKEKK